MSAQAVSSQSQSGSKALPPLPNADKYAMIVTRFAQNLADWAKMLNGGFGEGEAVLRIKTDLTHPNPAVRDWPALRIIDPVKYPHPRVGSKYRVWPLFNFGSAIDDHLSE